MQEKSAGIILFRREQPQGKSLLSKKAFRDVGIQEYYFLLLKYEAGHWGFSNGNIEPGEREQQAAIRELKEETGITEIVLIPGFKEKISFVFKRENQTIHKEVTYFLAETKELKVKLTEHTSYRWLPHGKAMKQLTFRNSQQLLKKAHDFLEEQRALKSKI